MTQAAGAGGSPPKPRVMVVVVSVGVLIAVASLVLAYSGWAQADAKYVGLNVGLFGYTTEDYVRFSVSHLFVALICLFAVGVG